MRNYAIMTKASVGAISNMLQLFILFFIFGYMAHILHTSTVHKTASLVVEGNSAYCQSSGAHSIKHI